MRTLVASLSLLSLVVGGCGDDADGDPDFGLDAAVDMPLLDAGVDEGVLDEGVPDEGVDLGPPCNGPPGLYIDPACTVIADGIASYNPQYWLWSDGTDKQRWISLPEDSTIDTTDPDHWIYPVGTRVWKTFLTSDGVTKLETRLLEKVADGTGWDFWDKSTYAWNEAQDAVEQVLGGRENVLQTDHDIPTEAQCQMCHANPGRADVLLGFSAIQLNHANSDLNLNDLNRMDRLTMEIPLAAAAVPSDGDSRYAAGLGYLHANCGNCHGGEFAQAGMRLWSDVGPIQGVDIGPKPFAESNVQMTAVRVDSLRMVGDATVRIDPQNPMGSTIFLRMSSREPGVKMPPIGTEVVDPMGVASVEAFINALPPGPPR